MSVKVLPQLEWWTSCEKVFQRIQTIHIFYTVGIIKNEMMKRKKNTHTHIHKLKDIIGFCPEFRERKKSPKKKWNDLVAIIVFKLNNIIMYVIRKVHPINLKDDETKDIMTSNEMRLKIVAIGDERLK